MSAPRSDRSPWNWLLVIPIVLPLITPFYNFDAPRLWGFPAFYWLQFAFILVGVATTSVVYQMTRRPAAASSSAAPPGSPPPTPSAGPSSSSDGSSAPSARPSASSSAEVSDE